MTKPLQIVTAVGVAAALFAPSALASSPVSTCTPPPA